MAAIAALIIGLTACPIKIVAEDDPIDIKTQMDIADAKKIEKGTSSDAESKVIKRTKLSHTSSKTRKRTPSDAALNNKKSGNLSLQIPLKLQVIIDPFNLDEKGQIYSEQYIIKNTGENTGTLTLSFACKPKKDSSLEIMQEKDDIHDRKKKSVYIEIVFRDTDKMVLSEESSEYQVVLEPEEELSLYFTGEVNENVSKPWKDSDIAIEGIYKWKNTEELLDKSEDMKEENFMNADDEKVNKKISVSDVSLIASPSNFSIDKNNLMNSGLSEE